LPDRDIQDGMVVRDGGSHSVVTRSEVNIGNQDTVEGRMPSKWRVRL